MYSVHLKTQRPLFIALTVTSVLFLIMYTVYIHNHVHGYIINHVGIYGGRRQCTLARLKYCIRRHSHFPGEGQWIDKKPVYFQPNCCRLSYSRIPSGKLIKCLMAANVSYIVTLGDSNAARYFVSINRALAMATNKQCRVEKMEQLRDEGFLPDMDYFVNGSSGNNSWVKNLRIHHRQCRGCSSIKSVCSFTHKGNVYNVTMEQAAMTSTLDDSIHVNDGSDAPTSQEFWLKYYLKGQYPNVLLIFLPFSHDKHFYNLIQMKAAITYFHNLVKTYIPVTTRVLYFPAFSEFESARKSLLYINRTYGGLLAAEKITKMNNILFEAIHKDITEETCNIHGFFDLFNMSLTREAWSIDGIHMQDTWYDVVISMMWQIICNH